MSVYRIKMSNGERWDVPLHIITDDMKKNEHGDLINDEYEVMDWATNNMNWEEVSVHAILTPPVGKTVAEIAIERQDGWVSPDRKSVV